MDIRHNDIFFGQAGDEQQLQQFYHDVQATVQAEARAYTEQAFFLF